MTEREQIAALGMQIRSLRSRIENAEQDSLTFEEEWALHRLEQTLDRLKGAGKVRRSAEINPTN